MGAFLIPAVVIVGVLAVLVAVIMIAKNYIKVPPEKAAVIYGRTYKVKVMVDDGNGGMKEVVRERGFRLVKGGAAFVLPFFEKVSWLDLNLIDINLKVDNVPSEEGVQLTVEAMANIKIGGTDSALEKAAEQFGGKSREEIKTIAKETMEGHLRGIVGKLTPEEAYKDRQKFGQQVQDAAGADMTAMGFEIVAFPVKDVRDAEGYIDALGKKRVAEVKKDAAIGEAEAKREESEKTSEAKRKGREAELKAEEQIAESERNLALKKATYKKETDAAEAVAAQAGPLAKAQAEKDVRTAQVEAEKAETTAKIDLAKEEAKRKEEELVATEIKPAEAARKKSVIDAQAQEDAASHKAKAITVEADANKAKVIAEGEATAKAIEVKGQAEAKADQAKREAVAAGNKADLLATAEGQKAQLLAEAEGKRQLAEALAKLDDTGKLLQVLDALPTVAEALGNAMAKALGPDGLANVFGQIAQPLSQIDEIRVLDMGGNSGRGGSPVNKLANIGPDLFFNVIKQAKALGLDAMLAKYGIKSDVLDQFFGHLSAAAAAKGATKKVAAGSVDLSQDHGDEDAGVAETGDKGASADDSKGKEA